MLFNFIKKGKYFNSFIIILLLTSCESSRRGANTEKIVGEWSARWRTHSNAFPSFEDENLTMEGKIVFNNDGNANIVAYGFQGCIFTSDTLLNKLNWRLQNDTISLINEKDFFNLSYKIKEINDSLIELELMQDIHLTLTRLH
jgi:hypothetical protein